MMYTFVLYSSFLDKHSMVFLKKKVVLLSLVNLCFRQNFLGKDSPGNEYMHTGIHAIIFSDKHRTWT